MSNYQDYKILAFFPKGNLDAFLGAYAAKLSLPAGSPLLLEPIKENFKFPKLDDKYLMFYGVDFSKAKEPVDITKSANCLYIGSIRQAQYLFTQDLSAMPPAAAKEPLAMRFYFTDTHPIFNVAMNNFVPAPARRSELTPEFFTFILGVKKDIGEGDNALIYAGICDSDTFVSSSVEMLERDIERFKTERDKMIMEYLTEGRRLTLDGAIVDKLIETYAMMTSDFAGYRVKIAHVPEEYCKSVGKKMAQGQPFAVVYEDRLATGTRIYHLFSDVNGQDCMKVAEKYNATGTARYCNFSVKMNFSNNKWL